jgi:hypothetical protein
LTSAKQTRDVPLTSAKQTRDVALTSAKQTRDVPLTSAKQTRDVARARTCCAALTPEMRAPRHVIFGRALSTDFLSICYSKGTFEVMRNYLY